MLYYGSNRRKVRVPIYCRRRNEGAALIIVMALLVLVTVAVLIELAITTSQRSTTDSNASGASAELLARSGAAVVVGQLAQEIYDGTPSLCAITNNTYVTYQPFTTNTTAVNTSTMRMAYMANLSGFQSTYTNMALVKESTRGVPFYSGANYLASGAMWASAASTTNASLNGRSISAARWNRPLFLPLLYAGNTTNNYTPFSGYVAPDWVYLTRTGPAVLSTASDVQAASVSDSSNKNFVIGRVAYNVYDVGGLLDVDAAGYNTNADLYASGEIARKGALATADLTQIPNGGSNLLTNQANALVAWRNSSTYGSGYANYVFGQAPVSGFIQPAVGDQSFASRQDLIRFWTSQISSSVDGLRYFTTFNRTLNAPAWMPRNNAADFLENPTAPAVSTLAPYNYKYNSDGSVYTNRNILSVRAQSAFVRTSDGTTAVVGEPLIKSRFDLNRLGWVTYNGVPPTGVTAQNIYDSFGLTWSAGSTDATSTSSGAWVYNHTATSVPATPTQTQSIMTLDQVSAAGREPDFFELLQAGILQGSVGLYSGDTTATTTPNTGGELYRIKNLTPALATGFSSTTVRVDGDGNLINQMSKYQIIQIGANMIDQYSSDNYPTAIQLDNSATKDDTTIYGTKNLPYFEGISERVFRPPDPSKESLGTTSTIVPNADQSYIHAWIIFSLWNPHMNAGVAPTASGSGPAKLRVLVRKGIMQPVDAYYPPNTSTPLRDFSKPSSPATTNGSAWIQLSLIDYPSGFAEPIQPTTANSTNYVVSDPIDAIPPTVDPNSDYNDIGIYVGNVQSYNTNWLYWNSLAKGGTNTPCPTNAYPQNHNSVDSWPSSAASGTFNLSETVPLNIELQYQGSDNNWHTYQILCNYAFTPPQHGTPFLEPKDPLWTNSMSGTNLLVTRIEANEGTNIYWEGVDPIPRGTADFTVGYLDPRTSRFPPENGGGTKSSQTATNNEFFDHYYQDPSAGWAPVNGWVGGKAGYSLYGPHFTPASSWVLWDDNFPVNASGVYTPSSAISTYYTDPDYVRRLGDSAGYAWSSSSTYSGKDPMMPPVALGGKVAGGGTPYRPIVLSRPFHSVGELGYTFRDDPWRSLDFFSNKSGDMALLDLFWLGPAASSTPTAPAPSVVGGTVNINSAPKEVLTALLAGAGKTLNTANSDAFTATLPTSDAQAIAQAILTYISTIRTTTPISSPYLGYSGPLCTPADLPLLLPQTTLAPLAATVAAIPVAATAPNTSFNMTLKTSRELTIRALAGSTSTRTWNVMIDVIAQAGRFTSQSSTLDQFLVKGERRYWVYIAIDRFTGKIVDQKIEFVPE